ncbi:MAG: HlyD family efflux transporter periplasmic adaptor subunit [Clostridia bacterium]
MQNGMQNGGQPGMPNNNAPFGGMPMPQPPAGGTLPYSPEQLQQWQQYGAPPQMTPDMMQQMWQFQQQWQQQPAVPLQQMTPEQIQQMQYEAYLWQMQQQMPPPPTMQQPAQPVSGKKHRRKPRKSHSRLSTILKVLLALALAGAVAWFFLKDMVGTPKQATATIRMGTLGTSYTGDALIVRNEIAYDEEGVQSIDYVAQEGSVIYRGDVVCYVYSTGYSAKEMTALQDYRDQIKSYQRTLLKSETAYDQKMTRLENEVVSRGLEVRSLVQGARGNLINQEGVLETAIEQRQAYFRSKYSSDMRLNRLYDDENTQKQRIEGWIKQKVAAEERIVSFYTDGFEYALTPTAYQNYTPTQVRSMINGQKPEISTAARGRTDLYRLVKKDNYAVLMLLRDSTLNPVEGDTYKLMLEQFTNTVVNAQVLSFTRSGGELLLRLAVLGDVSDVLYMRTCRAQLGEYVDCMVVPTDALYQQEDATGVVIVTDEKQFFVPVTVLGEEKGESYIRAIQTGVLTDGQTIRLFK